LVFRKKKALGTRQEEKARRKEKGRVRNKLKKGGSRHILIFLSQVNLEFRRRNAYR